MTQDDAPHLDTKCIPACSPADSRPHSPRGRLHPVAPVFDDSFLPNELGAVFGPRLFSSPLSVAISLTTAANPSAGTRPRIRLSLVDAAAESR